MVNFHITKDESLKASLEAHDIIGSARRFTRWAGARLDMLGCDSTEEPFCHPPPKSCPFRNAHLFRPLKTIVLPSPQEHTKQDASAPDENNKRFQVSSISSTEQASALCHFRAINLLSREEREPNFKTAYCVLPAWVALRHWEEKPQLFQASVNKQERGTETERD